MQKLTSILLILFFTFFSVPLASASQLLESGEQAKVAEKGSMARKAQRGFTNVVLSPFEFAHGFDEKSEFMSSYIPGWISGLGKSLFYTGRRAVVGAVELGTFFIPVPSGYDPILEPEFAWELVEDEAQKK